MSDADTKELLLQTDLLRALVEGQHQLRQDLMAVAGAHHMITLVIAAVLADLPLVERIRFIERLLRPLAELFPNWTPTAHTELEAQAVLGEVATFLETTIK